MLTVDLVCRVISPLPDIKLREKFLHALRIEMDSSFCSPPKLKRTVQMTPTGIVITPPSRQDGSPKDVKISEPYTVTYSHNISSKGHSPSLLVSNTVSSMKMAPGLPSNWNSSTGLGRKTSLQMEGEMVMESVLSLPQMLGEVTQMHKGQSTEIEHQQAVLQYYRRMVVEAKERYENLVQDINSVKRKLYLAEENSSVKQKACKQLDKDINSLVVKNEILHSQLKEKRQELKIEKRRFEEYRRKMDHHQDVVHEFEGTLDASIDLHKIEESIKEIQMKKEMMVKNEEETRKIISSEREHDIQKQVAKLKSEIRDAKEAVCDQEKKLQKEREKQIQTEQSTRVLEHSPFFPKQKKDKFQKRNAAQLTRLKKLWKEAQMRNRQWAEQAIELERNIVEVKQKFV